VRCAVEVQLEMIASNASAPAGRRDDAGELNKKAVTGGLDDATPMLSDFGIGEFTANRTQRRERALFVRAHQPRIAGDIDRQNGRQSSLDPRSAHRASPTHRVSAAENIMELSLTRAPFRLYIGANAQMATAGFRPRPASRGCAGRRPRGMRTRSSRQG
jgi:hypothetical protein